VSGVGEPEGTVAPVGDDCTQARLFKIARWRTSPCSGKTPTPNIPILKDAKAEYAKLQ